MNKLIIVALITLMSASSYATSQPAQPNQNQGQLQAQHASASSKASAGAFNVTDTNNTNSNGSVNNNTDGSGGVFVAPAPVSGVSSISAACSQEFVGAESVGLFFNFISHSAPRTVEHSEYCKLLNLWDFATLVGNKEKAKEIENKIFDLLNK